MLIKCYYNLKKKKTHLITLSRPNYKVFTGSELILFTNKNLKKNKTIH